MANRHVGTIHGSVTVEQHLRVRMSTGSNGTSDSRQPCHYRIGDRLLRGLPGPTRETPDRGEGDIRLR